MATILLVDDSASMRQMVMFTFKGCGHDVIETVNGIDALNKVKGVILMQCLLMSICQIKYRGPGYARRSSKS